MKLSRQWNLVLQRCVQLVTITACVIGVLLIMANDPDWDEFQKGLPAATIASAAGWFVGHLFGIKNPPNS